MPEIKKILDKWSLLPPQGPVVVEAVDIHKVSSRIKVLQSEKPEILSINNQEHGYFEDPENV